MERVEHGQSDLTPGTEEPPEVLFGPRIVASSGGPTPIVEHVDALLHIHEKKSRFPAELLDHEEGL